MKKSVCIIALMSFSFVYAQNEIAEITKLRETVFQQPKAKIGTINSLMKPFKIENPTIERLIERRPDGSIQKVSLWKDGKQVGQEFIFNEKGYIVQVKFIDDTPSDGVRTLFEKHGIE